MEHARNDHAISALYRATIGCNLAPMETQTQRTLLSAKREPEQVKSRVKDPDFFSNIITARQLGTLLAEVLGDVSPISRSFV
jgi:hypothetical protein